MFRIEDLFPPLCSGCANARPSPCRHCVAAMAPPPDLPVPAPLSSLGALVSYDQSSRRFVAALKYRNDRTSLNSFADGLVLAYPLSPGPSAGMLTWAPTTDLRRRERGFDQARLLATRIGRRLGIRPRRLLRRLPGPQQTGRTLSERLAGPAFVVSGRGSGPVVVVDDVCTTGATLAAAARVLLDSGFSEVHGLVIARTPANRRFGPADRRSEQPSSNPSVDFDT
jgi:predicted amidophosphoribosyltransferase